MKDITSFEHFEALDIRVGRIIKVEDAQTRRPTYRMTIDFGDEIGEKISCGAYTNYAKESLLAEGAHSAGRIRASHFQLPQAAHQSACGFFNLHKTYAIA